MDESLTILREIRDELRGLRADLAAAQKAAPAPSPAPSSSSGGALLPNYGRAKGQPIASAETSDLEYYAAGCRRSLADASKSRWHGLEHKRLTAIEAELSRRGVRPTTTPAPPTDSQQAMWNQIAGDVPDDDIPF